MPRPPVAVLLALAASACAQDAPRPAADPAPIARGRQVAERVCAICHQVVPERASLIEAAAPSFMEIANLPGRNRNYLRGFASRPHAVETLGVKPIEMPTIYLTPEEREDVVLYILSFQTDPVRGNLPPTALEPFE